MSEHTNKLSRRAFLGGAATFGAVSLLTPSVAFAKPTAAEKQAEADAVRIQVEEMEAELVAASDRYHNALEAADEAKQAVEDAEDRIEEANEEIADLQDTLGTRVRSMYRSGNSSFLDILLGATSFEEFINNWDLLNQLNQNDADNVQKTKDLREEVEALKVELVEQQELADQKLAEAETVKQEAEVTLDQLETVLNSLDAEARRLLEEEQAAAAAARARAEAERAAALAAQNENNSNNGGGNSGNSNNNEGNSNTNNNNSNNNNNNSNNNSGNNSGGSPGYSSGGGGSPCPAAADYAESKIGCWYAWGATGPSTFDCSGLTQWSYRQAGRSIPRTTESQLAGAKWRGPVSEAQRGDVLYRSGHVGICCGGGSYVHAPRTGKQIQVVSGLGSFSYALRF